MRLVLVSCVLVMTAAAATAAREPQARAPASASKEAPPPKDAVKPRDASAPEEAPHDANAPEPLPTIEEVRKLANDGDAAEALKQVNRLLNLRGKAAGDYDKYELLTLKGDAHLRMKAAEPAAVAFRQASLATDDVQHKAVARATELLIRKSRTLAYTPKKGAKPDQKPEAIDIVAPDSRQKALAALFVDEVTPLLPKVEAAKQAPSVAPMIKAMAAAKECEFLERAANGSADQVAGIVQGLAEQGKTMLTKVVEKATKRVDRITTLANDTEQIRQVLPMNNGGYRTVLIPRRRGVKREDVAELKEIIDAMDEVVAEAKALSQAQGSDGSATEDLTDSAQDLKVHVQRMLRVQNIEYNGRSGKDS